MTRRNILYLAHRIPYPPDKGDKIRSCHQLEYLSRRHDVWSAFFVDDASDLKHVDTLRGWCRELEAIPISHEWAVARGAVRMALGGTMSEGYFHRRSMRRLLRRWCDAIPFDGALVFSSSVAPYSRAIKARRTVLDFCDWDSRKWESYAKQTTALRAMAYAVEARRLRRRELRWLDEFDACTIVTEAEANAVDVPPTVPRPHVVGNGAEIGRDPELLPDRASPRIGFVGHMNYRPNVDAVVWFARQILPRVQERIPDATFDIVGRAPTNDVRALAHRRGICVIGGVDDVREHLERWAVSVAPMRVGLGVQNKVLEAMAAARPVVLSSTAAEGIDATDGEHFIVADEPVAMTDRVVELLENPARRTSLGLAARQHIASRYSWPRELAKLESLLLDGKR